MNCFTGLLQCWLFVMLPSTLILCWLLVVGCWLGALCFWDFLSEIFEIGISREVWVWVSNKGVRWNKKGFWKAGSIKIIWTDMIDFRRLWMSSFWSSQNPYCHTCHLNILQKHHHICFKSAMMFTGQVLTKRVLDLHVQIIVSIGFPLPPMPASCSIVPYCSCAV